MTALLLSPRRSKPGSQEPGARPREAQARGLLDDLQMALSDAQEGWELAFLPPIPNRDYGAEMPTPGFPVWPPKAPTLETDT